MKQLRTAHIAKEMASYDTELFTAIILYNMTVERQYYTVIVQMSDQRLGVVVHYKKLMDYITTVSQMAFHNPKSFLYFSLKSLLCVLGETRKLFSFVAEK